MINHVKSQPAPTCLSVEKQKANGSYRCGNVLERLQVDSHNKCYICEDKGITSINIEHFVPHRSDKDLMFDWNNLLFSCGHCNSVKSDSHLNLLNCTNPTHLILNLIKFKIDPYPKSNAIISALNPHLLVSNTVSLIDQVYNGERTVTKEIEANNLCDKIIKEICRFNRLLHRYFDDTNSLTERATIEKKIQKALNVRSSFTAFKVWVLLDNNKLKQEFAHLIPPTIYQENYEFPN